MTFSHEYLLLVFIMCSGVVQVAAAYGDLRRLQFLSNRAFSLILGMSLMVSSLLWFFWEGGRNFPDTGEGIAGTTQFVLFILGGFLALMITFLFTSMMNFSKQIPMNTFDGLASLRETTFIQALVNNIGTLWKLFYKLTRKYSSG